MQHSFGFWEKIAGRQPELPAWEVPKRDPHERRPRTPEQEPEELAAEIANLTAASDDAAGDDVAA